MALRGDKWPTERDDILKKLYKDGLSASQIAAEIGGGITRNAVIGRVHRLKLPLRGQTKPSLQKKPKVPRASPSKRVGTTIFHSRERKPRSRIISGAKPGVMTVYSILTGNPITVARPKFPRISQQMTKDELRNMLATAVRNTATMEAP